MIKNNRSKINQLTYSFFISIEFEFEFRKLKKIYSYELDNKVEQEILTILLSYILFIIKNFMVWITNFITKLHRGSTHMKTTKKHSVPSKMYYGIRFVFCVDALNQHGDTYNLKNLVAKWMGLFEVNLLEPCNLTASMNKKKRKIASTHKSFLTTENFSLRTEFLVIFFIHLILLAQANWRVMGRIFLRLHHGAANANIHHGFKSDFLNRKNHTIFLDFSFYHHPTHVQWWWIPICMRSFYYREVMKYGSQK